MRTSRTRYGLALASAATLASLSCGALVGAASADPGGGHDQGKHLGQVKQEDKKDKPDKPAKPEKDKKDKPDKPAKPEKDDKGDKKDKDDKGPKGDHGQAHGQGHGQDHAPGQDKKDDKKDKGPKGPKGQGEQGDPPGNNGTVKIAAPGDAVGHPSNNPHPGCTVVVEWFGYDAGDDVVSTVTFTPHAPTSDATIGGTSPSSVFVGGDAASGGTDLDGRQAYTLTFEGEPHPKQGYHVKLVVATPRSLGNDTKSKVFWVEPCESTTTSSDETTDETTDETPDETGGAGGSSQTESADLAEDQGVMGTSASAEETPAAADDADAAVPTAVDAGEDSSVVPDWARSPLPLVLVAGGLTLAGVAVARRSRAGA